MRLGFPIFWDGESIPVFEQANIELKEGEWTAILGCNGCGKSTLVRLMNGLLPLQNGNLSVNGINAGNPANKWELCKICGMVFQNPDNQFVSSVLEEDIAFGLENAQVPEREVTSKVKAALELVGLEGYEKRSPSSLSGGQKQRAALAGVLALNPEILIFDEATSMLDPKGRREVLAEMKKLRDCGKTVVMITHDVEEAVLADQVILMGCPNGQKNPNTVLAQGSVREILTDSRLLIQAGIVPPMAVRMYEDLKLAGIELNRCPLTKESWQKRYADGSQKINSWIWGSLGAGSGQPANRGRGVCRDRRVHRLRQNHAVKGDGWTVGGAGRRNSAGRGKYFFQTNSIGSSARKVGMVFRIRNISFSHKPWRRMWASD